MDAGAKTAQAEARSKSKTAGTKPAPNTEVAKPAETPKTVPPPSPEPARAAGLFDSPAPVAIPTHDTEEDEEILAEAAEEDQSGDEDQVEEAALTWAGCRGKRNLLMRLTKCNAM